MPAEAKKGLVPPDLLLGVALGGWTVEGGFNGPGQPANNWVRWERSGLAHPTAPPGHFWEEPEEVLDRVVALGCDAVGLSVEWARLEPEEDRPDEEALDRYADILTLCRQRGLVPVVTLSHQTHPWWLGEEFWLTPGAPDRFAEHVGQVVPRLAGACDRWVTIHQPNRLAFGGWVGGDLPPRRRGAVADGWAVIDNLLTAHVLAYRAIHRVQPEAMVTLDTAGSALYDYDGLLVDLLSARHLGIDRGDLDRWVDERRAIHDVVSPPAHLGGLGLRRLLAAGSPFGTPGGPLRSRLRRPSPRRLLDVLYDGPDEWPLDSVGFDGDGPAALAAWCRDQPVLTSGLPLWVVGAAAAADLGAVVDAVEAGAPVGAYLCRGLPSSAAFGHLVAGLRAGDRSLLAGP